MTVSWTFAKDFVDVILQHYLKITDKLLESLVGELTIAKLIGRWRF